MVQQFQLVEAKKSTTKKKKISRPERSRLRYFINRLKKFIKEIPGIFFEPLTGTAN